MLWDYTMIADKGVFCGERGEGLSAPRAPRGYFKQKEIRIMIRYETRGLHVSYPKLGCVEIQDSQIT